MSMIAIMRPTALYGADSRYFLNPERVLTPNPKEAALCTNADSSAYLSIDLGGMIPIDTVFVGYTNDGGGLQFNVIGYASDYSTVTFQNTVSAAPSDMPGLVPQHFLLMLPSPVPTWHIRITPVSTFATGFTIGVMRAGASFRPTWGQEFGAGRPFEDTSTVERLYGGGFGIDDGVVAPGYSWTFGDLQDADRRALYATARLLGQSKSVLVVEDPDQTGGLNERIHWGLFKLDTYERTDPLNTKWAFIVRDWL